MLLGQPVHAPPCRARSWPPHPLPRCRGRRPGRAPLPCPQPLLLSLMWRRAVCQQQAGVAAAAAGRPGAAGAQKARPPSVVTGQVFSMASNFVRVEVTEGPSAAGQAEGTPRQLLCSMRVLLSKMGQAVHVGDYVRVGSIDWAQGKGQVEEVLPRRSRLEDPAVANVEFALLVFALTLPPLGDVQVSRFLVCMEATGLPFRLVLNKADLVGEDVVAAQVAKLQSWGYEPLVVSCCTGRGMEEVQGVLQGRTSVVAGPSGVGKSSLINVLRMGRHKGDAAPSPSYQPLTLPPLTTAVPRQPGPSTPQAAQRSAAEASSSSSSSSGGGRSRAGGMRSAVDISRGEAGFLAVGDLTKRGRGRHTTTTATLIRLGGGGRLVDTPGFAQPSLEGVGSHGLAAAFPEIQRLLEREGPCRFADCMHVDEPGCVVTRADAQQDGGSSSSSSSGNEGTFAASAASTTSGSEEGGERSVGGAAQGGSSSSSSSSSSHAGQPSADELEAASQLTAGASSLPVSDGDAEAPSSASSTGTSDQEDGLGSESSEDGAPSSRSTDSSASSASSTSPPDDHFRWHAGLLSPAVAGMIEREGGVEEWLLEMESITDISGRRGQARTPARTARVERYPIYLKFLAEIQEREAMDVKSLQAGKHEREGRLKVKAGAGGRQRVEAKLQRNKHRRVSRSSSKRGIMDAWDE